MVIRILTPGYKFAAVGVVTIKKLPKILIFLKRPNNVPCIPISNIVNMTKEFWGRISNFVNTTKELWNRISNFVNAIKELWNRISNFDNTVKGIWELEI